MSQSRCLAIPAEMPDGCVSSSFPKRRGCVDYDGYHHGISERSLVWVRALNQINRGTSIAVAKVLSVLLAQIKVFFLGSAFRKRPANFDTRRMPNHEDAVVPIWPFLRRSLVCSSLGLFVYW